MAADRRGREGERERETECRRETERKKRVSVREEESKNSVSNLRRLSRRLIYN